KIGQALAEALRPALAGKPGAGFVHVTGLTSCQPWLVESLAKALGLGVWAPAAAKLQAGLDAGDATITPSAAGVLRLASQGSGDAPWVQAPLDVIIQRATQPAAKPIPAAAAPVEAKSAVKPAAVAPVRPIQAATKPVAKAAPAKAPAAA